MAKTPTNNKSDQDNPDATPLQEADNAVAASPQPAADTTPGPLVKVLILARKVPVSGGIAAKGAVLTLPPAEAAILKDNGLGQIIGTGK